MEEKIPAIFRPGAPGPAMTESARERAWTDFVVAKRNPDVAPLVLDSWVRSRDVFHIDPALERNPIVLPEDESRRRSERRHLGGAPSHAGAGVEGRADGLDGAHHW